MAIGQDPQNALIALNRFGLGARADDFAEASRDPRGFLAEELKSPQIALLTGDLPSSQEALQKVFAFQERRKMARQRAAAAAKTGESDGTSSKNPAPSMQGMAENEPQGTTPPDDRPHRRLGERGRRMRMARVPQQLYRAEVSARMRKQAEARAGYVERLVAFWSNHFAVSAAKGPLVRASAGAFEREAIRPHVLGRFEDMLIAVEQHPSMLFYLDNQRSMGPNSRAGRNRGKGLNENLAREILELHTLGVGGGYTQADVTSLARIITGWSFAGRRARREEPGVFLFRANWHEPGDHDLLGKAYTQRGIEQGEAAFADLARHPATARHIATKLVRHFVADDPPPALVERLTKVFLDTDGDLGAVSPDPRRRCMGRAAHEDAHARRIPDRHHPRHRLRTEAPASDHQRAQGHGHDAVAASGSERLSGHRGRLGFTCIS